MTGYAELLDQLGFPASLAGCAQGLIKPPLANLTSPPEWYGFPPALIPIFSDGSGPTYQGVWYHWFSSRTYSFVKMHVDLGHRVVEVARTPEQFFAYLSVLAITVDDEVSPELRRFAASVGLEGVDDFERLTQDTGDDPEYFSMLRPFQVLMPRVSVRSADEYDGEFPPCRTRGVAQWSSFELSSELLDTIRKKGNGPIWLTRSDSIRDSFDALLKAGELGDAWLCLNSAGWRYAEAVEAILRLEHMARNEAFTLLADVWSRHASKTPDWGY